MAWCQRGHRSASIITVIVIVITIIIVIVISYCYGYCILLSIVTVIVITWLLFFLNVLLFHPPDSSVSLSCHSVLRAIAPALRQGVLSAAFLRVTIVPFSVAGRYTCEETGNFIRRIPRCRYRAIQCCGPLLLRLDREFYPPDSSVSLSCHSVLRAIAPALRQGVLSAGFLGVTIVPFSVAGHCTCD